MARRLLMSRPGLQENHEIPLRLNIFDSVGEIMAAIWIPLSPCVALLFLRQLHRAGWLPQIGGLILVLGAAFMYVTIRWGTSLFLSAYGHIGRLLGVMSEAEATAFPIRHNEIEAGPWPEVWQRRIAP